MTKASAIHLGGFVHERQCEKTKAEPLSQSGFVKSFDFAR